MENNVGLLTPILEPHQSIHDVLQSTKLESDESRPDEVWVKWFSKRLGVTM